MRKQEYIYVQTGVCTRNKVQAVNTSSDLCQTDTTTFGVSGTTKIITETKTCDFSGISYIDILTGATECFTDAQLSGDCFQGTTWSSQVVADNVVVNDNTFFTGTGLTSDAPTTGLFTNSISDSLSSLGYSYSQSGTTFTTKKPFGVKDLRFDITVSVGILDDCMVTGATCGCPAGYSGNTGGDSCVSGDTVAATLNSGGLVQAAAANDNNANFGVNGTLFFPNVMSATLPVKRMSATANLKQNNGSGPDFDYDILVPHANNTIWNQRLNIAGIRKNTQNYREFVGFSKCIIIPTTGTYYIGIAADNFCKFSINGDLIVDLTHNNYTENFKYWHMFRAELQSGTNLIEMIGANDSIGDTSGNAFAAEIYGADLSVLTGATNISQTDLQFSTLNLIGSDLELGGTWYGAAPTPATGTNAPTGYSCPSGYALNNCGGGTPVCSSISYVPSSAPCAWTGSCEDVEYTACSKTYDTIKSGDTGVYIIDEETEIPFLFDFTGDTADNNSSTNFKFEVYKYDKLSSSFKAPAVFKSEEIPYSKISGATQDTIISGISVDSLIMDGDYLIKGYYKYDACTEFASKLGVKVDTANFKKGSEFGLYSAKEDEYFVAIRKADAPTLTASEESTLPAGALRAYSLIPDPDSGATSGQTQYLVDDNYNGNIMVALNGSTLANGIDYSLSGALLTLTATTYSGDVVTIVDTVGEDGVSDLKNDVISVSSTIVSGNTDGEGSNLIYYNIDKLKYEIYTSVTPTSQSDLVVTINGITLANNIDYYQSTSNPKRIILQGLILPYDIINIYYIPKANISGPITTSSVQIGFTIDNVPTENNGQFTVEVVDSTDTGFTTTKFSGITSYVAQENAYVITVNFSNVSFGDKFIYRIKNQKEYISVSGDKIISINYSEVVPIEIQVNNINSY